MMLFIDILLIGFLLISIGILSIIIFNNAALFSFLFVEYNLGSLANKADYPAIPLSQYIKNFWRELFYILGKYYFMPFKWLNLTVKGNPNATTAILLVHGYCRHQSDWLGIRKQFKDTQCPVFTVNLQPQLASIATICTNSLPHKITAILHQTNCKEIILIGHSMGGLVASYYSEYLDDHNLIKAVITVGSPLHGTKVSVSGAGDNAKDMCPNTEFLQELGKRMNYHPTKYFQVLSRFDNLIFPWRSALLDNSPAEQQLLLDRCGHLQLLHCKQVTAQLRVWVKGLVG